MENGEPFCILAAAVSRQSNQRRQNHWQRETTDQESGQYRLANGSQHLTAKQYILGSAVSPIRTKLGAPVAIKAMAAKLARLVYRMLRYGMQFVDQGAEFYETQNRNLQINYLKSKAAKLGLQIIEAPAA
jgi:hypothetical protein